jgi:hypothetical protein
MDGRVIMATQPHTSIEVRASLPEFLKSEYPKLVFTAMLLCGSEIIAKLAVETTGRYAMTNRGEFEAEGTDVRIPLYRRLRAELQILRARMPAHAGGVNEVTAAMLELSPDLRDSVVIAFCAKIENEVAAQILGVPWNVVRSRVERGRSKLAGLIESGVVAQQATQ